MTPAEREPTVSGPDVARLLAPKISEDDDAALIAEAAGCSTRTIWRILGEEMDWLTLDRADKLLTAIGCSVNECHLRLPDGTIEEPWYGG